MDQPRTPRTPNDAIDLVPLSSFKSRSAEYEAVESESNTDVVAKTFYEIDTSAHQRGEGSELVSHEQTRLSVGASPIPESPPSMQSPASNSVYEVDGKTVIDSNLPLLSPFVAVGNEQSLLSETAEIQSAHLQHALNCPPSSPPIPPTSSDPVSSTSPFTSDLLRSPFGGSLQATFPLSNNVPFSSSAQNCTPSTELSHVDIPELIRVETECRGNSGSEDIHISSDSGESSIGTPSTPTAMQSASELTASPPHVVSVAVDGKFIADGEIVCASTDCVSETYISQASVESVPDPSHGSSELARKSTTASEGPSSMIIDRSPHGLSILAPSNSDDSTSKELSHELSQESHNQARPQKKRPLDADDLDHAPAPKRITLASQKKQHQKLTSPFRSPLLSRPNPGNVSTPDRGHARSNEPSPLSSIPRRNSNEDRPSTPLKESTLPLPATTPRPRTLKSASVVRRRFTSAKATSQFKSPLVSSSAASTPSRMDKSRTIQELERKVQLLKRAVKIKKDEDEGKLEQLVKKWRGVGREAAWELWQIVRDNDESSDAAYPGTNSKSSGGPLSGSWGWAGSSGSGHTDRNWGWDEPPDKETLEDDSHDEQLESPSKLERNLYGSLRKKSATPRTSMLPPTPRGAYFEQRAVPRDCDACDEASEANQERDMEEESRPTRPEKSLGTMLHQIGIAHETLGWVEDEGDFVDA